MAMIFCPRCGKQISDKAPVCPHCKSPNPMVQRQMAQAPVYQQQPQQTPAPKKSHAGSVIAIILIVILAGVGMIGGNYLLHRDKSSDSGKTESTAFTNENPINDALVPKEETSKIKFSEEPTQNAVKATEAPTESDKYKVKLKFTVENQLNPTRTYSTNVYFDGEILCSLQDGEVNNDIPVFYVKRGIHTIRFEKNGESSHYKEITVTIDKDCTLSYHIKKLSGLFDTFDITRI
ncbi:MAG: zinc ribbon domain-containing protein [Ruminococcus sp.]|nr:zinc ribbon domain-containing protein [Ruminococcus sp.]